MRPSEQQGALLRDTYTSTPGEDAVSCFQLLPLPLGVTLTVNSSGCALIVFLPYIVHFIRTIQSVDRKNCNRFAELVQVGPGEVLCSYAKLTLLSNRSQRDLIQASGRHHVAIAERTP